MEVVKNQKITKGKTTSSNRVLSYKKRMLIWDSPVEYVNNMYGCHPNTKNEDYFNIIFKDEVSKS